MTTHRRDGGSRYPQWHVVCRHHQRHLARRHDLRQRRQRPARRQRRQRRDPRRLGPGHHRRQRRQRHPLRRLERRRPRGGRAVRRRRQRHPGQRHRTRPLQRRLRAVDAASWQEFGLRASSPTSRPAARSSGGVEDTFTQIENLIGSRFGDTLQRRRRPERAVRRRRQRLPVRARRQRPPLGRQPATTRSTAAPASTA